MKFKIDENLPVELAELLRSKGYDAMTVHEQKMVGCMDGEIVKVCSAEQRILVSFDTDFCDVRAYPPESYYGLVVFPAGEARQDLR